MILVIETSKIFAWSLSCRFIENLDRNVEIQVAYGFYDGLYIAHYFGHTAMRH